jgi:hypothetical protein
MKKKILKKIHQSKTKFHQLKKLQKSELVRRKKKQKQKSSMTQTIRKIQLKINSKEFFL